MSPTVALLLLRVSVASISTSLPDVQLGISMISYRQLLPMSGRANTHVIQRWAIADIFLRGWPLLFMPGGVQFISYLKCQLYLFINNHSEDNTYTHRTPGIEMKIKNICLILTNVTSHTNKNTSACIIAILSAIHVYKCLQFVELRCFVLAEIAFLVFLLAGT